MAKTPSDSGSDTPASEQSAEGAGEKGEDSADSGNADTVISHRPRAVDVAATDDPMAAAGLVLDFGEYGAFELKKRLGKGGMGEVYLAKQVGAAGFHQEVALKRLLAKSEEWEARSFIDEARILAWLRHENIAQIHAFFELKGSHVLVMEYIEGRTLGELFELAERKGRRLPEAVVCYLLSEVADALHYAHTAKDGLGAPLHVVHRDVSPSNIIVTETGRAKLVDFGVAKSKLAGRAETSATSTTIKGKVPYLSPEQAADKPLDGRSDLFSLGCVLVEALTGAPPFGRAYDFETIKDILEVTPEHVEKATPGLSRRMKAICQKLLARVPSKRFATGSEVADALREYIGRPYSASMAAREVAALEALPDASELPTARASRLPRGKKAGRGVFTLLVVGALLATLLLVWHVVRHPIEVEPKPDGITQVAPPPPTPEEPAVSSREQVPAPPAQPTEGRLTVNTEPKPDVRPATSRRKAPRMSAARTCTQALAAAGIITTLTACPGYVRTGAKAGDCPHTPVREVRGQPLEDEFWTIAESINGGPGCGIGQESCLAADGAVVARVYWSDRSSKHLPPHGTKLFGQARIVWGQQRWQDQSGEWFDEVGRLTVLFTEMRLADGTRVPICGVLEGSPAWKGEGVPMLTPNSTVNWGKSYVKFFY